MDNKNVQLVEVWGDVVDFKELLFSLAICTIGALGGYIIAPNEPPKPLMFGLLGVFIGFIICTFTFKPKREVIEGEVSEEC